MVKSEDGVAYHESRNREMTRSSFQWISKNQKISWRRRIATAQLFGIHHLDRVQCNLLSLVNMLF